MDAFIEEVDKLERLIADSIARSPAGVKLLLIGGFRYRLLDNSQRFSVDIDYHWDGDLIEKQKEMHLQCERVVLKEVKRAFGYEGSASPRKGPDAEAENASFLDLRFWKKERAIEIPIEITRIVCFDPSTIRTVSGIIHATASDADMIESKILAALNRILPQHRDFLDIFLYSGNVRPDSPGRIRRKIELLSIQPETVRKRLLDLEDNAGYHANAIQKVIDTQVDVAAVRQINAGGGGGLVLSETMKILKRVCPS
jgi:hypothetical protein